MKTGFNIPRCVRKSGSNEEHFLVLHLFCDCCLLAFSLPGIET